MTEVRAGSERVLVEEVGEFDAAFGAAWARDGRTGILYDI